MERLPELIVERGTATLREQPLDQALLARMLAGDLEIAQRMLDIRNYQMLRNALETALHKLTQLQSLTCAPAAPAAPFKALKA